MEAKRYILYKHTSPSGRVYIGITCKTPAARWGHGGSGYRLQKYFWRAIEKYGWDNFKHDVLLRNLTKEEAVEKEKEYIAKYRSNNRKYGYNLTSGGDSGFCFSQEVVSSISEKVKLQWKNMSGDEREAVAKRNKEISAKRTPAEKKEISDRAYKTWLSKYSPEERAAQRRRAVESRRATIAQSGGAWHSEECRAARSAAMKKYWEEYRLLHPKKKPKYRPPKVTIRPTKEDRIEASREYMKRKWQDPEYRKKMEMLSASMIGSHRTLSEETRAKMRKPKSEETKAKMRKPKSEETRRKMSEAKKKYFASKRNQKIESICPNQS